MPKSIFYVSVKTNPWPNDAADVAAIMEVARSRNADLGITGALISTEENFSQVIEGPAQAIDAVMASILADTRHRDVRVLEEAYRETRMFPNWSLAYAGQSTFVAGRIQRCLADSADRDLDAGELMRLIREFARTV